MALNWTRLLDLEKRLRASEEEQKRALSPTEIMNARGVVMNYAEQNYTEDFYP